jgi:nickel transport protein
MSFAQVDIAAPDGKPGFQSGRTDRNGMFLFLPDGDGKYRVTVGDDMGHRLVLAKTIAGDGNIAASRESRAIAGVSAGKGNGVVGGLGMIIGCGRIIYGWRQKRLYSMKANVKKLE